MKKTGYIRHSIQDAISKAMVLLIVGLLYSCSEGQEITVPSDNTDQGAVLNIYVYASDDPMQTRADEGLVDLYAQEKVLKSLKIWVFKHQGSADTDLPLHYLSPAEPELQGSRSKLFQIALTDEQVETLTADDGQVDLYVLANAESVGLSSLDGNSTRAEVRDAVIASGYFGTTSLTTDISTNGLPMSGCALNLSVQGTYPVLSLPVVKLMRCVSKLRFILSQNEEAESEISITSLQLDGNQFPETEQVFNLTSNPYSISATYVADAIPFTPPVAVASYDRVSDLVFRSQNVQDYEDLVDVVVTEGHATQMGPYYFRESNKCLTGTISYRISQKADPTDYKDLTKTFSMSNVPGSYNFSRNHTWTVYVYYLGGLELQMIMVYIREWRMGDTEHEIYNW